MVDVKGPVKVFDFEGKGVNYRLVIVYATSNFPAMLKFEKQRDWDAMGEPKWEEIKIQDDLLPVLIQMIKSLHDNEDIFKS